MGNQWEHITVEEFGKIRAVLSNDKTTQEDKMVSLAAIVQGVSEETILNLPIAQAQPVFDAVWGLNEPPKRNKCQNSYSLKGWRLKVADIQDLSVAQWVDFQTYGRDTEKHLLDILSCALVPKGKKYNEGYDIGKLRYDLKEFPICDALAVCFFFQKKLLRSMRLTLDYWVGWLTMRGKKGREMRRIALQTRAQVSAMLRSL